MDTKVSMGESAIVQAFKKMQVPLIIVGSDGVILECNHATSRLFGYDDGELIGRQVFDLLPVTSVTDLNAFITPPAVDASVDGMMGRKRDGTLVPLAAEITAWTDAEDRLQHTLVLRDITEEMAAAQLLKDEGTLAENAIKGARIGVFEYNPLDETIIVSDIWCELLELDPANRGDVQKEWRPRVHPEDLGTALEPVDLCMKDIQERASCEYRLRSRDGERWRWMRTDVAIAKRDATGRVIRLIGAMTDITERKMIENALRRSVEQFKSAFDHAPIGKTLVGLDGKFLKVNPALCDFLGYVEEDLLRTDFQTLTHADDLDEDLHHLGLLKSGKIPSYQIEKRYIRANGAVIWGLLSVGLVKNASGQPDHYVSQIMDVTEQRRLSELKSEFVATVSHELRTPLTSVLGALDLLSWMDTEPLSDEANRLLHIAQENGKRLRALVDDILDFEKFSLGKIQCTLSQHRIVGLVEEAVMANSVIAEKYGVRFKVDCPDRSLMAYVDPKLFHQVMTNLLSNSAKFAAADSKVDVTVESHEDATRVSVSNEGVGIPDSFRDQVFRPFAQAAASATRARGGTGLGLNISKQIVEQTMGTIGFDSTPGGRTTFWFTVPVNDPG